MSQTHEDKIFLWLKDSVLRFKITYWLLLSFSYQSGEKHFLNKACLSVKEEMLIYKMRLSVKTEALLRNPESRTTFCKTHARFFVTGLIFWEKKQQKKN